MQKFDFCIHSTCEANVKPFFFPFFYVRLLGNNKIYFTVKGWASKSSFYKRPPAKVFHSRVFFP